MPTRAMNKDGAEGGGCMHVMPYVESPAVHGGDRRFLVGKKVGFKDVEKRLEFSNSASESSSIGKNSDVSEKSSDNFNDNEEVQSSYKGPLDAMEALEEVLPIRRGISSFYNGKSKSFASLGDASSLSVKSLSKPENAYTRKRRNLLACSIASWDVKNRHPLLKGHGGGISKRVTNSSRTTLALAVAMSNDSKSDKHHLAECNSSLSSSPKKNFPVWRSFSLADLQQSATTSTTRTSSNQLATNP